MRTIYQKKMIKLGILVMIIGGLSIGFAAFSSTLNIRSQTTIKPNPSNFKVVFSSSETEVNTNPVYVSKLPSNVNSANAAIINNTLANPTISGINVRFTKPSVDQLHYYFYLHNTGELTAYLKKINFKNIDGETVPKKCIAGEGTTDALVQQACEKIKVMVGVRDMSGLPIAYSSTTSFNKKQYSIEKNNHSQLSVTLTYTDVYVDGPFEVQFGDIELIFDSIEPAS